MPGPGMLESERKGVSEREEARGGSERPAGTGQEECFRPGEDFRCHYTGKLDQKLLEG